MRYADFFVPGGAGFVTAAVATTAAAAATNAPFFGGGQELNHLHLLHINHIPHEEPFKHALAEKRNSFRQPRRTGKKRERTVKSKIPMHLNGNKGPKIC